MPIAEQFAGLRMDELIGGPLSAAADASRQLAHSTAEFIQYVGFNRDGSTKTARFAYQKRTMNDDGTSNLEDMNVEIPMLAIVPIPNLQIDEVNILFDMEVKQSEKSESSMDLNASASASLKFGFIKVNVSGSVSAHNTNTRSSDNSAKYHVDVRATNHGTPEGLARVLDMVAANIAPTLVGSTLKDENGQDLSDQAKKQAQKRKTARQEIDTAEKKVSAYREVLNEQIQQMKRMASSQVGVYQSKLVQWNNANDDEEKEKAYQQSMDTVNQSWSNFQNQAEGFIKMIASGGETSEKLSPIFGLKALDASFQPVDYGESENYYSAFVSLQKSAVEAQKKLEAAEQDLSQKKTNYNELISSGQ